MVYSKDWWKKLLALKEFVQQNNLVNATLLTICADGNILCDEYDLEAPSCLFILLSEEKKSLFQNKNTCALFVSPNLKVVEICNNGQIAIDTILFIKLYLPFSLLNYFSVQAKKVYSIAHLTQSVDGRIATVSGQSKWIGNKEDLLHAHCMRSLCDAVIVGNNTLRLDEPKLTVRNVEGKNPIKVIIGNSKNSIESLLEKNTNSIFAFSNQSLYSSEILVKEFVFEGDRVHSNDILRTLYQQGIHSVYIEGGANTISCFLKEKSIDILQVHIANKILGSGKISFCLDEIQTLDESVTLHNTCHYKLGNEILIVSTLTA